MPPIFTPAPLNCRGVFFAVRCRCSSSPIRQSRRFYRVHSALTSSTANRARIPCVSRLFTPLSAFLTSPAGNHFQRNEIHVVIANIQAGGVGVSLHDPEGQRSRLSIISPTFSAADLRQALGRVHRSGGAASIQKICFAAGTCEEHTAKICAAKLAQIDLLNDGDMQPFPIQ